MGDLISNNNELIVKSNYKLRELNMRPYIKSFEIESSLHRLPN